MKTKVLIELLQKEDPSGEQEVCINNMDIHYVCSEPAYWDGPLQVLERDEECEYYNIIGAKYRRSGVKVNITPLSISDAICNNTDLPVDYSELNEDRQVSSRKAHDNLRAWYKNMENELEENHFVLWAKKKAESITSDFEDVVDIAKSFFKENLDRNDPLPQGGIPLGESYVSTRESQWDSRLELLIDDGFLKIQRKT